MKKLSLFVALLVGGPAWSQEAESLDTDLSPEFETAVVIPDSPDEIEIPYIERDMEAVAAALVEARDDLIGYCEASKTVVIGKVLTSRVDPGQPDELVELMVETTLRGESRSALTVRVPRAISGDVNAPAPPWVVEGYRLLVFLDSTGTVVMGNALFFAEAGYAFRNKRPDTFLMPRSDRDWIENIDPTDDYVVYAIKDIEEALGEYSMQRTRTRKRFCPFRRDK